MPLWNMLRHIHYKGPAEGLCNETHQHENTKMSQQTQSNRPLRTLKEQKSP